MPCVFGDQPLRIKLTKKGVTHAGSYQDYGGFHQTYWENGKAGRKVWVPKEKRAVMVCRRWNSFSKGEDLADKLIDKKENITCKSCQKIMGFNEDTAVFPDRFVIRRISDGQFLKNTSSRCTAWSEHVSDAWFWKRKGDAERRCHTGSWWLGDKRVKWGAKTEDGRRPEYRKIRNPDYEIRKVKITLED